MTLQVADPERLARDWFAQDEKEFNELLQHVTGTAILEVGTRYGESLRRFAARVPSGSLLVSVDLGQDPFSPHPTEDYLHAAIAELSKNYCAQLILGNSHDPAVVQAVRELGPFSFGFIDGDHTTEGVLADWTNYSPMCKVIAFHDIRRKKVNEAWQQIRRAGHNFLEIGLPNSPMGIGVVFL